MSTNATVGILTNGRVKYIYNHFDGYPEYLLKMLIKNYNEKDKIEKLIGMGDMSSLKESLEESSFYHRDRGEGLKINKCSLRDYETGAFDKQEYNYIFINNEWLMYKNGNLFKFSLEV